MSAVRFESSFSVVACDGNDTLGRYFVKQIDMTNKSSDLTVHVQRPRDVPAVWAGQTDRTQGPPPGRRAPCASGPPRRTGPDHTDDQSYISSSADSSSMLDWTKNEDSERQGTLETAWMVFQKVSENSSDDVLEGPGKQFG